MLLLIVEIIAGIILLILIVGFVWNIVIESNPDNKTFLKGSLPAPALNGSYSGTWDNSSSWEGKEFDSSKHTGINLIDGTKKYTFETSDTKSLHSNQQVLKLNYNVSGNPLWLRFIVDEVVQTKPGHYQGKVYVQFIPGLAVTVTYFQLDK